MLAVVESNLRPGPSTSRDLIPAYSAACLPGFDTGGRRRRMVMARQQKPVITVTLLSHRCLVAEISLLGGNIY